jgi:hypothetical protein
MRTGERSRPRAEIAARIFADEEAVEVEDRHGLARDESRHGLGRDNVGRITNPRCTVYPVAVSKGGPHGYEQITTTKS